MRYVWWAVAGLVLLIVIAINSDPKQNAARATRDAVIERCAQNWLNPKLMGYRALPGTWAGINEAVSRCNADVNALVNEAARR